MSGKVTELAIIVIIINISIVIITIIISIIIMLIQIAGAAMQGGWRSSCGAAPERGR